MIHIEIMNRMLLDFPFFENIFHYSQVMSFNIVNIVFKTKASSTMTQLVEIRKLIFRCSPVTNFMFRDTNYYQI